MSRCAAAAPKRWRRRNASKFFLKRILYIVLIRILAIPVQHTVCPKGLSYSYKVISPILTLIVYALTAPLWIHLSSTHTHSLPQSRHDVFTYIFAVLEARWWSAACSWSTTASSSTSASVSCEADFSLTRTLWHPVVERGVNQREFEKTERGKQSIHL